MNVENRPRKVGSAGAEFVARHPISPLDPDQSIRIDCTKTQATWLEAHLDTVEASPADGDRCRFLYKDGRVSSWFNLTWKLVFSHVAPLAD